MGIIVSSTIGCGKTSFIQEYGDKIKIEDMSSKPINDDNVLDEMEGLVNGSDILFVSSDKDTISTLISNNVDFDIFYPSSSRKIEFIENQVRKRSLFQIIRNMDANFDKDVSRIDDIDSENVYKHKLANDGEFIGNNPIIMKYVENIIKNGNKGEK